MNTVDPYIRMMMATISKRGDTGWRADCKASILALPGRVVNTVDPYIRMMPTKVKGELQSMYPGPGPRRGGGGTMIL